MINGIINVYKEKGYTSHDVVAKLRGIVKQKKIGHTGTLDPDAEGVLPICLGNGTKVCDLLTGQDKTYEAILLLGQTTDTQDTSGTVLSKSEVNASRQEIEEAIYSFIGEYDQIPPMYSAIKINGKRLYELARAGKEVERAARKVRIQNIHILNIDQNQQEVRIVVDCSKGTYIRTLCHDIGAKLGCGGCMKSLLRTKVGQFSIENSIRLSEVEKLVEQNQINDILMKVDDMFTDYKKVIVAKESSKYIYNGNSFSSMDIVGPSEIITEDMGIALVRVYDWEYNFVGIYQLDFADGRFKPVKMFL